MTYTKKTLIVIGLVGFLLGGSLVWYVSKGLFGEVTNTAKKDTVFYSGVVAKKPLGEEDRVWISNLTSLDPDVEYPGYEEVILLTGGTVLLIDEKTGEKIKEEDIKVGAQVLVELEEDAPMTMSIPPQIPGDAVVKITIKK